MYIICIHIYIYIHRYASIHSFSAHSPISRPGQQTPKDYMNTAWDSVLEPLRKDGKMLVSQGLAP